MTAVALGKLFDDLPQELAAMTVSGITTDSRNVTQGGLFLAVQGFANHGLEFLDQALENGAAVVAWEPAQGVAEPEAVDGVLMIEVQDLGLATGILADEFFGHPSMILNVAGITGTNGKTTTAWLAAEAANRLGAKSGYMGTLGYGFADQLEPAPLTTPGVVSVHRRLSEMADAGAANVFMEVSSHGLDQGRVDAVRFKVAAFTNLSRDHLDYHGSLEAYGQAKAALFTEFQPEFAVLNVADEFGRELARLLHKDVHLLSVSADPRHEAALVAELVNAGTDGLQVRFSGEYGEAELHSSLWGRFNVENLAVATGILLGLGVSLGDAVQALAECAAPAGRMEPVSDSSEQPQVIIDFAHTPDALEQVLNCVREHCDGALWCVFGCGGDRDTGKRAEMGRIAGSLADRVVLTDDNPRDEDPAVIIDDVLQGFIELPQPQIIHDRAEAITTAVGSAVAGDVVLVAGKGAENYQIRAGEQIEFSDQLVAKQALAEIYGGVQ